MLCFVGFCFVSNNIEGLVISWGFFVFVFCFVCVSVCTCVHELFFPLLNISVILPKLSVQSPLHPLFSK